MVTSRHYNFNKSFLNSASIYCDTSYIFEEYINIYIYIYIYIFINHNNNRNSSIILYLYKENCKKFDIILLFY